MGKFSREPIALRWWMSCDACYATNQAHPLKVRPPMSMYESPLFNEAIKGEAAAQAARLAHMSQTLDGLQERHRQSSVAAPRDAVIDAAARDAGLAEPAQRADEVGDAIAQAGLTDSVRQRQRASSDPDGH